VYDIMLKNDEGQEFVKWDIRVNDNEQVVFTAGDLVKGEDSGLAASTKILVQGASQSAAPAASPVDGLK